MSVPRTSLLFFLTWFLVISACSPAVPENLPTPTSSIKVTTSADDPVNDIQPTPTDLPSTTIPGEEQPTIQPTSNSPVDDLPIPSYILDVTLDYNRHHVAVEQSIHYTNRSGEVLRDLLLVFEPVNYPGVFQLGKISWADGKAVENTSWDESWLHVPLPQPLNPGEAVDLSISFELNLPAPIQSPTTRPVPFGYSERQTNLVDWYPYLAPYIPGQGWLAHKPYYYGEHQVYETADFQVNLRLAGDPDYLTIAASAPDEGDQQLHRYTLSAARSFALSISHDYQVFTQQVGEVTVFSYTFPIHATAGERTLQTTVEALELFNGLFGPYPHKTLSVVEADFLDGMEYDGLYFLSNGFYNLYAGTPSEYLVAIAAHETAHQWWYGIVGNDQALEPWLDEALCTYSERLYYEHFYPEALDWWWTYRINYYEPKGWIDTTIYNPEGSIYAYRSYRDAVYLNGAKFFEDLRTLVGDDVFFPFLKTYALTYDDQIVTKNQFFDLLRTLTNTDLEPLLKIYFQSY